MRALRGVAGAVVLAALGAACDDANVAAPEPPGPTCPYFDDFIHTIAVGRPSGRAFAAASLPSLVFSANGADGVFVIDYRDPSDTRVVGTLPAMNDARGIDAAGNWLFVANGNDGLAVVDVSAPSVPRVARVVSMPGAAVDVQVEGPHAYVANELLGLVVIDVANPAAAAISGIENTPGRAVSAAVSGTLAVVGDHALGLRVVNVADPAAPFLIRTLDMPGVVEAVDMDGDLAAVAAGTAGLQLVDVSRPAFASPAGEIATPGDAIGVALAGELAFVADANTGVLVVDVGDASQPVIRGTIGTPIYTQDVSISENRLAIADDESGARVLDISSARMAPVDSLAAEGDARALALLGDLVVVADASVGLLVVDPVARAIVGEHAVGGFPNDVAIADSIAYVARLGGHATRVDLHNPALPVDAGVIESGWPVNSIGVEGDFAYLLFNNRDVTEMRTDGTGTPRSYNGGPVFYASLTVDRDPVLGTLVYLPDRRGGVTVVLASIMSPFTGFLTAGSAERVVVQHGDGPGGPGSGTLVYVAVSGLVGGASAIEVHDFTDKQAPVLLDKILCGGGARDVALSDDYFVAAEGSGGCEIFERLAGFRSRPVGLVIDTAWRVAVSGHTLVVAGGNSGVLVAPLNDCLEK